MSTVGASGIGEASIKNLFVKQIFKAGINSNNSEIYLPLSAHIIFITCQETTGNAVTGGIDIGATNGAADIVSAFAVPGNFTGQIPDAAQLKQVFTGKQQLFVQAHTGWNGASINLNFIYVSRIEYGT